MFGDSFLEQNTGPPASSRWLLLTLLVGLTGLILIVGKLIQNLIMMKLLEKANKKENKDEENQFSA